MDPQLTLLHNPPHVLGTPSLEDESECPSQDVTRGEAAVERHDAAPTWVNAMAPSRSPMQANYVADGGVVQNSSMTATSSGSSFSSPLMDDESENWTSISPFSQAMISAEPNAASKPGIGSSWSPTERSHEHPDLPRNGMVVVPISLPDGRSGCPRCPRKFLSFARARYEPNIQCS